MCAEASVVDGAESATIPVVPHGLGVADGVEPDGPVEHGVADGADETLGVVVGTPCISIPLAAVGKSPRRPPTAAGGFG